MTRTFRMTVLTTLIFLLALTTVTFAGYPEPEALFDVKLDKPMKHIYMIGDNEDYVLITNKSRIWVYDGNTGKLIWEDRVPKFIDDGLELFWNSKQYYIVSMKKGMRCYDVPTGKMVWETDTELKMKNFTRSYDFNTGYVLRFGKELKGFDPNTGKILWESDKLDHSSDFQSVYEYNYDFGGRLLVLGNKVTSILDAANGQVLGEVETKYNPAMDQLLFDVGQNLVLLGKSETFVVDMKTGKTLGQTEITFNDEMAQVVYRYNDRVLLCGKKITKILDAASGKTISEFEVGYNTSRAASVILFEGDYGRRIAVIGKKEFILADLDKGGILSQMEAKFQSDEAVPLEFAGTGIMLTLKDHTVAFKLSDGSQMWDMEDEFDVEGVAPFVEYEGTTYGIFSFKKQIVVYDIENGKELWRTTEETDHPLMMCTSVWIEPDGTMIMSGLYWQMFITGKNAEFCKNPGSFIIVNAYDLQSGTKKWGPSVLGYSMAKAPGTWGYGLGFDGPEKTDDGLIYYTWGNDTKKLGDFQETKWYKKNESGYQGFIMLDPSNGNVKWSTDVQLFDTWMNNEPPNFKPNAFATYAGHYMKHKAWQKPDYLDDGTHAILRGNGGLVKVNYKTGELVWDSPDYGCIEHYTITKDRIFGPIGVDEFRFGTNEKAKPFIQEYGTHRRGYFVIDANTGKELWSYDDPKGKTWAPAKFLETYDEKLNMVFLCSGTNVWGINLADGKAWELDMIKDKKLTGGIGLDGVVREVISSHTTTGYYTITTVTNYELSMQHGARYLGNGYVLLLAKDGPACLNKEGNVVWATEWDWNPNKITFNPKITKRGILYRYKKRMNYISLMDGSYIWQSKEAKKADFRISNKQDKLFIIEDKNIAAYKI